MGRKQQAPPSGQTSVVTIVNRVDSNRERGKEPSGVGDKNTSARKPATGVQVEQIESETDARPDRTGRTTATKSRGLDRLQLPGKDDTDETSDSSSQLSPHTDANTDDDSIAVNCHTNPSEVIVRGKNVKQIRVKFSPHPPAPNETSRSTSGHRRLHRSNHGNDSTKAEVNKEPSRTADDNIPYSKEETSLPANPETNTDPYTGRLESGLSYCSEEHGYGSIQGIASARSRSGPTAIDWDLKHKQDVLSGLEYFETKAAEFKILYLQSQREVERLKEYNTELEERLKKMSAENACLLEECDELKIKLDQSEKENLILRGQAQDQWQGRVKVEDMYMELQKDSQNEITLLRRKLDEAIGNKAENLEKEVCKTDAGCQQPTRPDDVLELRHAVVRLTEDRRRMNCERDALVEKNAQLMRDLESLRAELKAKDRELDSQYKRFLSLKKSFNNLSEENDKLRELLGARGLGQHQAIRDQIAANTLANYTWPAGKGEPNPPAQKQTISYIDLPKTNTSVRMRRNSGSLKTNKPLIHGQQRRPAKCESITAGDNLPPVTNTR